MNLKLKRLVSLKVTATAEHWLIDLSIFLAEAVSTLGPIRVTVDGVEKDNNKPTIMLNSNGSMRSFQTAGERGVDLNDLREALGEFWLRTK